MQMQINNNKRFPECGNDSDVIERLCSYISYVDKKWEKTICSASCQEIESFKTISGITKYNLELPKVYLDYLKKMGKNDGGMIGTLLHGEATIQEVMELYEECYIEHIKACKPKTLIFFTSEMGADYEMELNGSDNPRVTLGGFEISETFEKFLFQCAFMYFESKYYQNHFSFTLSKEEMKKIGIRKGVKNYLTFIDQIIAREKFCKLWFSDKNMCCIYKERCTCWIKLDERIGDMVVCIHGIEEKEVEQVGKRIVEYLCI